MKRRSLVTYLLPCLLLTACAQTAQREAAETTDLSETELSAESAPTEAESAPAEEIAAEVAEPSADEATAAVESAPEAALATPTPEPTEQELAAKLLPLPPQEIVATVDKLVNHPRVQWLSGSGQYGYYVGGRFNALYDPQSKVFTINSDGPADNQVTCKYASDGSLMAPEQGANLGAESTCTEMINDLTSFLAR